MKLSDTQSIILSAAAQRADGNVLPLPGSLRGGAAAKVVAALLARAILEWFRPPGRALSPIAWGFAILVAYGLIMPAWAKLDVIDRDAAPAITFLLLAPIFLNTLVPAFRALVDRFGRAG